MVLKCVFTFKDHTVDITKVNENVCSLCDVLLLHEDHTKPCKVLYILPVVSSPVLPCLVVTMTLNIII